MHSFKVIVGAAPNGVITYVIKLYQGSISDKAIVQQSGLLNHLTAEDLVPADKRFLIQDLVPNGVSVNIPPFLSKGTFTKNKERANARLTDFKILSFIPSYFSCVHRLALCSSL